MIGGRFHRLLKWLGSPGSRRCLVAAMLAVAAVIFIIPWAWAGFSLPPGTGENYIQLVGLVLTASIAILSILVAVVAIGLGVLLQRHMTALVKGSFREPVFQVGTAWILASVVFGYVVLLFGPNSDLAWAYLGVGVVNLVVLALGVPYVARMWSFPELVRLYGDQTAWLIARGLLIRSELCWSQTAHDSGPTSGSSVVSGAFRWGSSVGSVSNER